MRNTMLDWIEAADARSACEHSVVVLITRRPRVPMFYAAPVGVLLAVLLLTLGL